MIILILHAWKKENSSSKIYEVSKWSFGDAILMTDWKLFLPHFIHFISIGTPLTKEPIYNLTLQMYTSFPMCVCYFYYCCCKLLTNNQTSCWDIAIDIEQVFSKTICTIGLYMMCLMYLSGTMINLIKIYILLHFFKYFFWRNRISKGKVI